MFTKNALIASTIVILSLTSCAHQSKVPPSQGHIDGAGTTPQADQAVSKSDIPKPVKSNVYLPPPKARAKEQTYSVVVNEVPVKEILFALARESKLNVDIHPSIQGSVTMNAVDQTLSAILERISSQIDLIYKIENNVLSIKPDAPYVKSYPINYVNMERTTKGGISVTNQIAGGTLGNVSGTTGGGAAAATSQTSGGTSGGQNQNNSSTSVSSISENKFWTTLIDNVKELLFETDKEVLVKRFTTDEKLRDSYGSNSYASTKGSGAIAAPSIPGNTDVNLGSSGSGNQTIDAEAIARTERLRENASNEYKKLYAASVIPNKELGILSVRATNKQHEKVQEFLDKIQASAKRQVLIEASIVEVDLNDRYQAGVDWSRLGNGFTFQQQLTSPTTSLAAAPRFIVGYATNSTLGNLAGSISLLQTFGTTKVLSSPKLMVLNSQTAVLKSVDNLVYFNVQATAAITSGTTIIPGTFTTTAQTVPVGVWMSVTPQINESGIVTLNVRPTISRKIDEVNDPNPSLINTPNKIPIITVRELESVLQVPSGSTVVLGGLMEDTIDNRSNAVPEVSRLPIFGNLFRARNNFARKKELVIFIKPTVITNATLESEELNGYKQFLPQQQLNAIIEGNDY